MLAFILASRFFQAVLRPATPKNINITSKTLPLPNGRTLEFDHYQQQGQTNPRGTILFTHGMTQTANKDARLIKTAQALTSLGFEVLAPLYPSIQNLNIGVDSVDDIANSMRAFLKAGLCINNELAIFSVSFSGIQAMRAASSPDLCDSISAILALGTANRYRTTMEYAFAPNSTVDLYTRMILLRNLILFSEQADPEIDQAFMHAIKLVHANNKMSENEIIHSATNLSAEKLARFKSFMHDLFHGYVIFVQNQATVDALDKALLMSGDLENLHCPISLIHSADDNVLLPSESITLSQELENYRIPVKLTITTLISHVNHDITIRKLPEIFSLLNGFAFFFSYAQTR